MFSQFPNLPKEIQMAVWEISILEYSGPRVVELTFERGLGRVVSLTSPPAALGVCAASREVALQHFPRLEQPSADPPIYIDLERDVCFLREDTDGVLADQNLLLVSIFGNPHQPPICNLLGMKNVSIDYWIMERAWNDLTPLNKLRGLGKFWITMADNAPQRVRNNPANLLHNRVVSINQIMMTNQYFAGSLDQHIQTAVERFWGIGGLPRDNLTRDITDLLNFFIHAEMSNLVTLDPTWRVPVYQLMTYGAY